MKNSKFPLRCLCEGAILVALAQLLGYVKLYSLPQGGSINPGMLPIFLFCARWGFAPGMLASFAYSLLQLFLDGAYAWGWQSILGDYLLAYTVLGVAGLFCKRKYGFFYGTVVGIALRFVSSYITGVVAWGQYMPDEFFGMTMTTPWFYSALYNGFYMLGDCVVILVIGILMWKPLGRYLRGEDIRKSASTGA